MQEFGITLDDAFVNGLRPDPRLPRNAPYAKRFDNLKPTPMGGVSRETVEYPITSPALVMDWPYPKLIRGKYVTLLCYETAVYTVDESTWACTAIATKDYHAWAADGTISAKAITGNPSGGWHLMDFYDSWILYNGIDTVIKTGLSSYTFTQDEITIRSGCNFKDGRVLMCGFDPGETDYGISAWREWLAARRGTVPEDVATAIDAGGNLDYNWVWWSSIGGGDMLYPFGPNEYLTGDGENGYPRIFDLWKRNETGSRPMPWKNKTRRILPLGNALVCYAIDGIGALLPVSEPSASFGSRPIVGLPADIGTPARQSMCGTEEGHIFVDQTGDIWAISPDLKAERLGFGEYIATILSSLVISYDPVEKDHWLSNGTSSYILTKEGRLGGPFGVVPTSLSRHTDGTLIGAADGLDDTTETVHVETCEMDMGDRGTKHVPTLESAYSGLTAVSTRVGYKYDSPTAIAYTPWQQVNLNGTSFPNASFVDGTVSIKGTRDVADIGTIERIGARVQYEDKRFRRGPKPGRKSAAEETA